MIHANVEGLHVRCVHACHCVVVERQWIAEAVELIGQRQQRRDLDRRGIEQTGRDNVIREWRADVAGDEWVVYRDLQAREVPAPLIAQRNAGDHRLRAMRDGSLVVREEEGFIAFYRSAQRSAELVVAKRVLGLAGLVGEEVGRVQRVVAKELKQRSVQLVGTGFRLQVNDAARHVSVLSGIRSGLHRELANVFQRNVEVVPASFGGRSRRYAIHQIQICFRPLPIDIHWIG